MSCNGHSIHNSPFEPNFRQGLYLKSYLSLYQAVSAFGLSKAFDIVKEDYVVGYDLTADQCSEEGQLHPIKTESLRIELQFAQTLAAVINVIVFAEFDNQIEINSLREIITDYLSWNQQKERLFTKTVLFRTKKKKGSSKTVLYRTKKKKKECWDSYLLFHWDRKQKT